MYNSVSRVVPYEETFDDQLIVATLKKYKFHSWFYHFHLMQLTKMAAISSNTYNYYFLQLVKDLCSKITTIQSETMTKEVDESSFPTALMNDTHFGNCLILHL